jgi:hypothetical protein
MELIILILVVAGALSIIVSGVWVAIALIRAISVPPVRHPDLSGPGKQAGRRPVQSPLGDG